jgi:ATP-binding cassette subfamily D (ALD) long-chain fatty acid import protein
LTLGLGEEANEYEFVRIGTASEKDSVEKEIQELREKLSQVDHWKQRRQEIDVELNKVWVSGQELPAPDYQSGNGNNSSSEGETVSFS